MAINSFLMELDGRWVLWELGQDTLAFCALEDVGEIVAPGAERYDGENWYRGAPPFEAPGAPATAPPFEAPGAPATARVSSRSKKAICSTSVIASDERLIASLIRPPSLEEGHLLYLRDCL